MSVKQAENVYWKTKDGRKIAVNDMSDSHILNAHRFMRSRLADSSHILSRAWSFLASLQGEMAQECMEREIYVMEDREAIINCWIWVFEEELDRRSLIPLREKNETN